MKKSFLLSLILSFALNSLSNAQDLEKSPKRLTFETGYSHIYKSTFSALGTTGFSLAFDYMWQVSGFKKKPAAFISIPLGYTSIPPLKDGLKNGGLSYYGIHITHEVKKDKKIIPFFGYSLLFNQFKLENFPGRVIGHETRFDGGAYYKKIFLKAEYSIASYPILGFKNADKLGTYGLKLGYRIK